MKIKQIIENSKINIDKNQIRYDEPMKKHTSFKVGGNADAFITIKNIDELKQINEFAKTNKIPLYVIGNGSNLLVRDKGIRGIVVKIDIQKLQISENDKNIIITIGAGNKVSELAYRLQKANVTGFEELAGIPGTIGGAIRMNAGAYGGEIKDIIVSADVLDRSGRLISLSRDELELGYRTSCIAAMDYIVVSAVFRLQKGDTDTIKALIKELAVKRRAKQPLEYPSAGSTFKRPQGFFAAKLIEDAGLKGVSVGGAMVSEKHSGFVVNTGNATAKDVCMLTDMVKDKVKQQSGVDLELEVIKLGDFS